MLSILYIVKHGGHVCLYLVAVLLLPARPPGVGLPPPVPQRVHVAPPQHLEVVDDAELDLGPRLAPHPRTLSCRRGHGPGGRQMREICTEIALFTLVLFGFENENIF